MITREKFGIFRDDIISATELNQQPEAVLDKALDHPVTIMRKDQAFALLPREQISKLTETLDEFTTTFEVVKIAYGLRSGVKIRSLALPENLNCHPSRSEGSHQKIDYAKDDFRKRSIDSEHPYEWLTVFDSEELDELIEELLKAFSEGMEKSDWKSLKAIIHEWHESAIAIKSQELAEAFASSTEEVPLTPPTFS